MTVSIVIPVYNEEKIVDNILSKLSLFSNVELVVVDGGSYDSTVKLAKKYPVKLVSAIKNRAVQCNVGAKAAKGDILVFLHSDCMIEQESVDAIINCVNEGFAGGCFTQRIEADRVIYRFIEHSGNMRAKIVNIFYGDQAIFVRKDIFFKVEGFDKVELFDDMMFSRKLKRIGKVCVLDEKVYTSPRRWEKQGIAKTTIINWLLTLGFWLGVPTLTLKKIYFDIR